MKWDRHRGLSPQLGMQELPGQTVIASLTNYLRDKRLLLVLDNEDSRLASARGPVRWKDPAYPVRLTLRCACLPG